jgi:hypothetical protein
METISTIVFLVIIFILYKKGMFRSRTYIFYKMRRTSNRLSISYKKFDGLEHYSFCKPGGQVPRPNMTFDKKDGNLIVLEERF